MMTVIMILTNIGAKADSLYDNYNEYCPHCEPYLMYPTFRDLTQIYNELTNCRRFRAWPTDF